MQIYGDVNFILHQMSSSSTNWASIPLVRKWPALHRIECQVHRNRRSKFGRGASSLAHASSVGKLVERLDQYCESLVGLYACDFKPARLGELIFQVLENTHLTYWKTSGLQCRYFGDS